MSDKPCKNVLSAIYTGRWAIETNHLDLLISIADRSYSNLEAVLATPTDRRESGTIQMRDGVAVLKVFGPIFPRSDMFSDISGATNVQNLAFRFNEALTAPDVKAIVLDIDSPGGNIVGIHEFANQIFNARGIKPIIAYTGGYCASAAYWIASACDEIVADKTAFLGSIGVVAAWTDDSEARKKSGLIDYEVVSSQSPNKRVDLASDDGRSMLQKELDALADIFISSSARNRGVDIQTVTEKFGKGGILLADEAIKSGMADKIGSLENLIQTLSKGAISVSENTKTAQDNEPAKGATISDSDIMAIKQEAAAQERSRVKAIVEDVAAVYGFNDAVKAALSDGEMTAEKLALQLIKSDKATQTTAAANLKEDAAALDDIPASANNESGEDELNRSVSSMMAGMKGSV